MSQREKNDKSLVLTLNIFRNTQKLHGFQKNCLKLNAEKYYLIIIIILSEYFPLRLGFKISWKNPCKPIDTILYQANSLINERAKKE